MKNWFIAFLLMGYCSASFACGDYQLTSEQSAYFKKLDLPYKPPQGVTGVMRGDDKQAEATRKGCVVVGDFNGDGADDFAGIFHYQGQKTRASNWWLDLIVMYSDDDGLKHMIFPFAGQYDAEEKKLLQYLDIQMPGDVDLMPGRMMLSRLSIKSYRSGRPAAIYYWNGKIMTQRAMGVDD